MEQPRRRRHSPDRCPSPIVALKRLLDLALKRLISMRRRRRVQDCDGMVTSMATSLYQKGKKSSHGDNGLRYLGSPDLSEVRHKSANQGMRYLGRPDLPEDIWSHIHFLMPQRDAARIACVSRSFLNIWRRSPSLVLNNNALNVKDHAYGWEMDFIGRANHLVEKRSGIVIKRLIIEVFFIHNQLSRWLQAAVKPGIEEITVTSPSPQYNFPCSLLSDGVRSSIRHLELRLCAFHPPVELGSFGSLTRLHLESVRITGEELECFLSRSFALEQLEIISCSEIICLKIHCLMQRLSYLKVGCSRLQVLESNAPNLSVLNLSSGLDAIELSLEDALKVKEMHISSWNLSPYALLSKVPNLERLTITSLYEVVNTLVLPTKFFKLKYLKISLIYRASSPSYDYYFSLVNFLDASPSLEDFTLDAYQDNANIKSIFGDSSRLRKVVDSICGKPSHLRQMTERHHNSLKNVKITSFSSAKSLVELTCHIIENSMSLECLTLDTTNGYDRCSATNSTRCYYTSKNNLMEAPRALLAIKTYIERKVPSTVKLSVLEPCKRCPAVGN